MAPFTKRPNTSGAWDTKAHPWFKLTLEITRNTHRFAVASFSQLFNYFLQRFVDFDKRLVTSTEAHTCFFTYIIDFFFFIDICYGSLSQFVLRHHTGEREGGEVGVKARRDTEPDVGTEEVLEAEAGVLRCSQTPDER